MSTRAWHADDALLCAYVDGEADMAAGAAVEAHLVGCADCRGRLAGLAPAETRAVAARAWAGVVAGIATPRPSPAVRALRRLGVSEADAVLLRAARSLDGPWTLATLAVIAFAAFAALGEATGGVALYLLLAPLVPVIGVVVAFASTDPLGDVALTTPFPVARLALLRTAAVCITSVPIVVALGLAVPPIGPLAVAWLAPAIALTLLSLAAMTWVSPTLAGAGAGALWLAVIAVARAGDDVAAAVAPRVVIVHLVVAAAAALCLAVRLRTAHAPGGPR